MRALVRALAGLALSAALLAVAIAAGCGGGDEDLTEGLTPEQILEQSREAASAVRFYHPELTLTLGLTPAEGSAERSAEGVLGAFTGGPVTIVAEGPVRRPIAEGGPAFSFDLTVDLGGITLQGNLTKLGDAVYLSLAGQDFVLPLSPDEAGAVRIPPEPALFIASPVEVGHEEVDGVETVHLAGTVDTDAVVDYLLGVFQGAPALLGDALPDEEAVATLKEQVRAGLSESSAEVWIGTEDLLPRRVAAHAVVDEPLDLLPGVSEVNLDVTAEVGGFDEEVEIVAPANPQPFDPSRLLPGLGG